MTLGQFFFKYRSYTPIPFLFPLIVYARPTIISMVIGLILIVVGEYLRFWGVSYAGGETRTRNVGASSLVTQGPFAIVRNPLYIGNILMYFGISIMSNSLFPFLQIIVPAFFIMQYYFIIKEEEAFLREKFADKYDDYFKSVNRFLPKAAYPKSKQSKVKQDNKAAFASEKRTFQGTLFIMVLIVLIYILIHQ